MKKRRGTPSRNHIVTGVFAVLLCASSAQAENHTNSSNATALGSLAKLAAANVLVNPVPAKTVTGKVVDDKGEALIGVSVTEQGTTKGVVTDANGNFSISVEGDNSVLVFTYLGYETQNQTVGARTVINVTLQSRTSNLEEVVVTALGIKREAKKLGYSATSVKTDEMQTSRTNNMMNSLQGKVAGLNISPPAGGAGASTRIRLRGQSSFAGGNNAPLMVINGLPMDQGANGANGNDTRDLGDNMTQFNPDDIETMTVLKGATAAALYGERASNGAIIITTKSGAKNQKFAVDFSSNFAADEALDFTNYQTIYGQGQGGVKPTPGNAAGNGQLSFGAKHDGMLYTQFDGKQRPYSYQPNRIKDFYRTGINWTNSVAFSGGNASTSYRASFSNQNADGITPNNSYNRKVFNFGLNSKAGEKLTFQFNLNYANENNNNPPQVGAQGAGAANALNRLSGTIPLSALRESTYNADGSERAISGFVGTLVNPYFTMDRQFYYRKSDRILSTLTGRYDFAKWLYVQGRMNMELGVRNQEFNTPHGQGNSTVLNNTRDAFNGDYNVQMQYTRNTNMDVLLGSSNKIGDFGIDVSVGGNMRYDFNRNSNHTATGFVVQDLYSLENGFNRTSTYRLGRRAVNSVYGVAEFSYKSYLYLTVSDRIDYYSVLTPPSSIVSNPVNSFNYPSVAGSFVFSELLPNASWLNYGKLRASWADVGNAPIGEYGGQLLYNVNPNLFGSYQLGGINGLDYPNPRIKPYGVSEVELGLELKTLNSRLNFDFAYYVKTTRDQIIRTLVTPATGYFGVNLNTGKLQNRGFEVLVDATPVKTQNFTWNTSVNSSYNFTKVLDLGGQERMVVQEWGGNEFIGKLIYEVGKEMNQIGARTYARNAQGQPLVRDNGTFLPTAGDVLFGSANSKVVGGWNNNFRYKNLSLLVQFDWKFGGKILSSTALNGARQGINQLSLYGREGGIVIDGVNANTGLPNTRNVTTQDYFTAHRTDQIADPFIYKADFIKLRNISVSYDFTKMIGNKLGPVKGVTLSGFVRNVAIIKKYIPDVDPEAMASTGDSRLGYEGATIPTTRTYGLNLNVKF